MNAHRKARNPVTIALFAVGLVALSATMALAFVSAGAVDATDAEIAQILVRNAWSNYLLQLATITWAGATVLVGVRWLLRTSVPAATPELLAAARDESRVS